MDVAPFRAAAAAAFGALVLGAAPAQAGDLSIRSLSSRADSVSAGDALLRVTLPKRVSKVTVTVGGRDVSERFREDPGGRTITGLVSGLRMGSNEVVARTRHSRARLRLTNHHKEGPIFSGPHETPFRCETHVFAMPVVGGTFESARSTDPNCGAKSTRVDYIYRTTGGSFRPLPASATAPPADTATTTTSGGAKVPYIVRMETGTANRSVYQIAVLHDRFAEPDPDFATRPTGWNGRLIYTFGGGCTGGWYRQGASTGGVTDDFMLRSGYAVASSSLNVFGNNCQDVTAAESMAMVKERFVEAYGAPKHTIGFGCSGGSYQQHQIADNYPGLLDGIIPGCSFPEVGFGTVQFITDAWLLDSYFKTTPGWSTEQKRQVTGFATYATAPNVANGARRIDPRVFCPGILPVSLRYHPVTNRGGARCDVYDHTVNVYGRDPDTGFARRPLDNVGIQYGLASLDAGTISVDQFLELNEKVGGFDSDANLVPQRTVGDTKAIRAAYRTGRLTNGGGGLASVPIIDYRAYNDDAAGGDIHVRYHSFSMRERLRKANGRTDNHVMLVEDMRYGLYGTASPMLRGAITGMDEWLGNIADDRRRGSRASKVARNRPDALREGCNTRDAQPRFIAERQRRDPSTECERLYPSASFPREVAGSDIASDIVKCRLQPLDRRDYRMTDAQWARLRAIFPHGVCDWSKRGVEQRRLAGTWLEFGG